MKYELRENHGIPAPLLALMAVATGLSVANCYYNQPLLGSMAKDFGVSDFSASMVATLTQIGYVVGLVFVIPLGDLVSRKQLILTNYIISSCALLAIALSSFRRVDHDAHITPVLFRIMMIIHVSDKAPVVLPL